MAEAKTRPTKQRVRDFIHTLPDQQTRADCTIIAKLMKEATKTNGVMWGGKIAGFGTTTITYADGREAEWPLIGFSPRKQNLTLYVGLGEDRQKKLLSKLGKHTTGTSCLYIKRLSDVDLPTLKRLIEVSAKKRGKAKN